MLPHEEISNHTEIPKQLYHIPSWIYHICMPMEKFCVRWHMYNHAWIQLHLKCSMEEITFDMGLGEYLWRKAATSLGERRAYNVIRGRNEKKKKKTEMKGLLGGHFCVSEHAEMCYKKKQPVNQMCDFI